VKRLLPLIVMFWLTPTLAAESTRTSSPHWNYMAYTGIKWHPYDKQAFTLAQQTHRPVFVLVYSDKCGWCEKYEKEVLETKRMRRQLETDFVPVFVNFDNQPVLAKQLKARVVPTSLILAPDGSKLLRFYGIGAANEISDTLQQVRSAWLQGKVPEVDDFGDKDTCCPIGP